MKETATWDEVQKSLSIFGKQRVLYIFQKDGKQGKKNLGHGFVQYVSVDSAIDCLLAKEKIWKTHHISVRRVDHQSLPIDVRQRMEKLDIRF